MNPVEEYYDSSAQSEWGRLDRHRTEFAVTLRALDEHLPQPPAEIVDIGGGPGRYTLAMLERGFNVTLVDLAAANLALAQEKCRLSGQTPRALIRADARDLSPVESESFDAALLMGPLYHLLEHSERQQALKEARRVLRPGGVIGAAFITRSAPFRYAAVKDPQWLVRERPYAEGLLATGRHDQAHDFAPAFFAHPQEVVPAIEQAGFAILRVIGCEGVVAGHEAQVNALSDRAWEAWVDFNYRLGQDPALWGAADHLLVIAEKN